MSWDISLINPVTRETIHFDKPHQMQGGTYALGGTTEAWLNVTYNYSRWYYRPDVFDKENGIRLIDGMLAGDSIPVLEKAITALEEMTDELPDTERVEMEASGATGYWLPTRENAIVPLYQLLLMAQMKPDAMWEVV